MAKKVKQISPARAWCFTVNNYTDDEYSSLVQQLLEHTEEYYFCVGKEVGDSGTPHLQGFIQAKDKYYKWRPLPKWAVARGDIANVAHWSKMKKTRDANYNYCRKDGLYESNCPEPRNCKPVVKYVPPPRELPTYVSKDMYVQGRMDFIYLNAKRTHRWCLESMNIGGVVEHCYGVNTWFKW